jgi:hypothetical protein
MKANYLYILVLFVIFTSCDSLSSSEVKYVVECNPSGFDVTYQNSSGGTAQQKIISSSWRHTFTASNGDFVYVSAQAMNENTVISTKIYYKNKLFKSTTSYGDYVISEVHGLLDNSYLKNDQIEMKVQQKIDEAVIPVLPSMSVSK